MRAHTRLIAPMLLLWLSLATPLSAHGLHADVGPRLHWVLHGLQALAILCALWLIGRVLVRVTRSDG